MPLQYATGTVAEHLACRRDAVVFDVSHLGTVRCDGAGMFDALQSTLTNDLRKIAPGRAQYTHLLERRRLRRRRHHRVVGRRRRVRRHAQRVQHLGRHRGAARASTSPTSAASSRCRDPRPAPRSRPSIERFADVQSLSRDAASTTQGVEVRVAGTGYTGEEGLEIAAPNEVAEELLRAARGGRDHAGRTRRARHACASRRRCRSTDTNSRLHVDDARGATRLGARLGQGDLPRPRRRRGRARARRSRRLLTGVIVEGRQPLRDGGEVFDRRRRTSGTLTSGNFSPVLERGIGMGLLRRRPRRRAPPASVVTARSRDRRDGDAAALRAKGEVSG